MGQFSWITQDTRRSISSITPFQVTMTDNKGNKWTENYYKGYGEFGGKDFYSLLSEMNGGNGDREHGIDLYFSDKPHISPNLNEDPTIEWVDKKPESCPNQGWVNYDDDMDKQMKTFIITETRPAYATWTYEVQAETEAEAIDIIENGDAECIDFDNDVDYESEAEYSVEEA